MKAPSFDNTEGVLDLKKGKAINCLTMSIHRLWTPYGISDGDISSSRKSFYCSSKPGKREELLSFVKVQSVVNPAA